MARLRAYLKRWWHCLRGMFSGHCMVDAFDSEGRVLWIGCECGRAFWTPGGSE